MADNPATELAEIDTPIVKRGVGRPAGFTMNEHHRLKLRNSNLINVLLEHALGRREMSATQVTAGLGLAKKFLPDLAALTVSGDAANPLTTIIKIERTIVR